MYAALISAAALWGAATGVLLPRAAYRLAVEPGTPWRTACPAGHPLAGAARGWLGTANCRTCALVPPSASAPAGGITAVAPAGPAGPSRGAGEKPPGPPDPAEQQPSSEERGAARTAPREGTGARPGRRYARSPLLVVVSAAVCAALAAAVGSRPELAVWLLITPFAVLLAVVDRAVHRLPDRVTLPLAPATALLLGAAASLPAHGGSWPTALLGALALGGGYCALFLLNPSGLGFGDVKLALTLGCALGWYGWPVLFAGAFAGFLFGGGYGLVLLLLRRADRAGAFPFGPFMIGGAFAGVLLGGLAA